MAPLWQWDLPGAKSSPQAECTMSYLGGNVENSLRGRLVKSEGFAAVKYCSVLLLGFLKDALAFCS